ncbi:hypothetical protein E2C01_042746 [Portunus trituberculatus]|uniref:Uncharacterized protein n=1 Tax=Portunus trituberculatus TaxID=210409 RepID=A0A5B7FU80_PORTR|nr:hypothetical protein [Portunus trituberculatus]
MDLYSSESLDTNDRTICALSLSLLRLRDSRDIACLTRKEGSRENDQLMWQMKWVTHRLSVKQNTLQHNKPGMHKHS